MRKQKTFRRNAIQRMQLRAYELAIGAKIRTVQQEEKILEMLTERV